MTRTGENKRTVELFYHISLDSPVGRVVPTPESAIEEQLEPDEIDALAAGTLVEIPKTVTVSDGVTKDGIIAAIKVDWMGKKISYNKQFDFEYGLYGVTLNVET